MNRLEEIKNEVALEYTSGKHDWSDGYLNKSIKVILMDKVSKRYALEAVKAERERVAENAKMAFHCGTTKTNRSISYYQSGADNLQIDKESILNLPIELK